MGESRRRWHAWWVVLFWKEAVDVRYNRSVLFYLSQFIIRNRPYIPHWFHMALNSIRSHINIGSKAGLFDAGCLIFIPEHFSCDGDSRFKSWVLFNPYYLLSTKIGERSGLWAG